MEARRASLRAAASAAISGPCVLDASERTILNFAQGSFSLVERDIALLPLACREAALRVCELAGVRDAFAVRRELISFKKVRRPSPVQPAIRIAARPYSRARQVCLNVFDAAQDLEKDLQQLTTYHYYRLQSVDGAAAPAHGAGKPTAWLHSEEYTTASRLLQSCRGSLHTVHDARQVTKLICSIARHPSSPRLPQLVALLSPGQTQKKLAVRRVLHEARSFASEAWVELGAGEVHVMGAARADAAESKCESCPEAAVAVAAPQMALGTLEKRLLAVGLGEAEAEYVMQSLIARGACKALGIVQELWRFLGAIRCEGVSLHYTYPTPN
jgi:hypothetical protein